MQYCDEGSEIKPCQELVSYRYKQCGHVRSDVECHTAFGWSVDNEQALLCHHDTNIVNPVCGHQIGVQCFEADLLRDWNPWLIQKRPIVNPFTFKLDENSEPILGFSMREQNLLKPEHLPPKIAMKTLGCPVAFEVQRECGHTLTTTCSKAYWHTYIGCVEEVSVQCSDPQLRHVRYLACSIYAAEKRAGKPYVCKNDVKRVCIKCNVNQVASECYQPAVECNAQATVLLECSHEAHWTCGSDPDPRTNPHSCHACIFPKWDSLFTKESSTKSNQGYRSFFSRRHKIPKT